MQFVCTNKLPQMHSIPSAWIYSSSQNFLNISTRQKSMQCYGVVVAAFFLPLHTLCATWLYAFELQNIFVYVNVVYGVGMFVRK